ncbi:class I SAM-dependent methyltransferase [Arcticibacterium luteifluviistationis]|uniref:Class I SAM-dependent methyltransferase n=1 Tax=Arcticibacterium luteifluviistationis TaxID=1784714 RepID=A0A2Z4GFU3_9BACT|nr:class I SAM-dependent methyltransferase [Arcticibacterium luteifluviistationis]AWV99854.1 class I SAM-dependent methyltransferase [Arcticibacterium luteifluviistationis]
MKCRICNNLDNLKEYQVREMMFGFRDKFSYLECTKCGCLQIAEIPNNISKYYPSNYYSYSSSSPDSKIKEYLKGERDNYAVSKKGLLGNLVSKYFPNIRAQILSEIPISKNSKILDVGCGNGVLLLALRRIGFVNISGIDPFIENDISYGNGLDIYKKMIHEVKEKQDVIMFHHSFEHMPDPLETFQTVSKLLNKGGYCIIRVPTVSSYAWKHYRENWVQLDAPRHFFLHSEKSIDILAKKVSLTVEKVVYDSTELQFLGSERYLKNIPLLDATPNKEIFSSSEIKAFKLKAIELNQKNNGDSCAFIIKK